VADDDNGKFRKSIRDNDIFKKKKKKYEKQMFSLDNLFNEDYLKLRDSQEKDWTKKLIKKPK